DELIAVVSLADGCDVTLWRTTAAIETRRPAQPVAAQIGSPGRVSYATFLTWRGFLPREPPRRPDPERPAAPPPFRADAWNVAFPGSRGRGGGARPRPPQRVCVKCHAVDRMTPERLADKPATIATFTVDRLAYSLSPPVVAAVIDFEGGGRFQRERTADPPARASSDGRVAVRFRPALSTEGG